MDGRRVAPTESPNTVTDQPATSLLLTFTLAIFRSVGYLLARTTPLFPRRADFAPAVRRTSHPPSSSRQLSAPLFIALSQRTICCIPSLAPAHAAARATDRPYTRARVRRVHDATASAVPGGDG